MAVVLRILLFGIILVIVAVAAIYFYLFQAEGLETIVNRRISAALHEKYNIDLRIGHIGGDFWSGLTLRDVGLTYNDSSGSYKIAHIPVISASYSLSNLWNRNFQFADLIIDSASINIHRDATGRLIVPDFTIRESSGQIDLPLFMIERLTITHAAVSIIDGIDTTGLENLTLAVSLEGSGKTYSLKVDRLEFGSLDNSFGLDAAAGKLTYHDRSLVFLDVTILSDETRVKLSGRVNFKEKLSGYLEINADNVDLAEVSRWVGPNLKGVVDITGEVSFSDDTVGGSVDLAGELFAFSFQNLSTSFRFRDQRLILDTLYGSVFDGCVIDGSGYIDFSKSPGRYLLNAEISDFNLKNLVTGSFPSDLNGRIVLRGESFKTRTLLLNIQMELYESSFDGYPLHEVSGEILVTADSIVFADSFRVDYFENSFLVSGVVEYLDSIDLEIHADLANLDRYKGKLFIDQPGGRGIAEGKLTGRTAEPDLEGIFYSDSVWIYGLYCDSLYGEARIDRFLTGKQGEVQVVFFGGQAWPFPYDTGFVSLTVDSNLIHIDSSFIKTPYSSLSAFGQFDYGQYPMSLNLDRFHLELFTQEFTNRGELRLRIDSAGFDFDRVVIESGDPSMLIDGRLDFDESMELILSVNQVEILPWLKLFDEELSLEGILSCEATLSGSFMDPAFRLNGRIDSLTFRSLLLGDLMTSVNYRDKILTIDSLLINSYPGEYYVRGTMPLDLAFTTAVMERLPESPMDIRVRADDSRFDLVSLMLPSVEQLDGDFHADFILTGTAGNPHLEGRAHLVNGRLKYFDLEHPLFVDSASVVMSDNKITIAGIEAYATRDKKRDGKRKYLLIDGELTIKSLSNLHYSIDLSLPREFPFSYELDDIRGVVEGELHIEGDSPPLVTGNLILLSTKYEVEFAEPDKGSPIMMALSGENRWDLDITIDILSNYWIKNSDIDAEFSGQINLVRQDGKYRFTGEMEILRGRGFLFDKTFRLDAGGQVIFEGKERFNPRLDMIAHTRVQGISASRFDEDSGPERIELNVRISGTVDTVEINPVSGSGFTREDIIPLLVANYYSSDSTTAAGPIEQRVFGLMSGTVSQVATRQLNQMGVGVETFEVEPFYGAGGDALTTRITVGFYTTRNLYLYGRSPLSGQTGQEVGFEYRFNKAFFVEGRRDEDELYHLNLKLHWEY